MIVNFTIGNVAAFLTVVEFLIGILIGFSAHAFIHGIWLVSIRRAEKPAFDMRHRKQRRRLKEVLVLIITTYLVLSVAFVESDLRTKYVMIRKPETSFAFCTNVNRTIRQQVLLWLPPPFYVEVPPWVLDIIEDLKCNEKGGIDSIGTGRDVSYSNESTVYNAPTCREAFNVTNPSATVGVLYGKRQILVFSVGRSDVFEILPYDKSRIGPLADPVVTNAIFSDAVSPCVERGISPVITSISIAAQNSVASSGNFTTEILNTICRLHGSKSVTTSFNSPDASAELLDACVRQKSLSLNVSCAVSIAETSLGKASMYNVDLEDMSVLLVGKNKDSASYVCLRSKLRYHYMFMNATWMQQYIIVRLDFGLNLPILVPTKIEVLSGHCEETIHLLGRAALLFTMSSEWKENKMSRLDHISRYHAFMMTISGSNYAMDKIDPYGEGKENNGCRVRRVIEATNVPTNWRYVIFCVGVVISIVLMVLGCIFRSLAGPNWEVGSTKWMIHRLINKAHRQGAVLDSCDLNSPLDVVRQNAGDREDRHRWFKWWRGRNLTDHRNLIRPLSRGPSRASSRATDIDDEGPFSQRSVGNF